MIQNNFIKTKTKMKNKIKTKNQKLLNLKNKGKCNHIYSIQIGRAYLSIINVATALVLECEER